MNKRYIRFIDSNYNTKFYVPDGGEVRVHSYDGSIKKYRCEYIDVVHAKIGPAIFHICEFAELMERNGNTYTPVQEIGDLDFYSKRFYDHENIDSDGMIVPYYILLNQCLDKDTRFEKSIDYAVCFSPVDTGKTFCRSTKSRYNFDNLVEFKFAKSITDLCDDEQVCNRINNIIVSIQESNEFLSPVVSSDRQPALDGVIRSCEKKSNTRLPNTNRQLSVNQKERKEI